MRRKPHYTVQPLANIFIKIVKLDIVIKCRWLFILYTHFNDIKTECEILYYYGYLQFIKYIDANFSKYKKLLNIRNRISYFSKLKKNIFWLFQSSGFRKFFYRHKYINIKWPQQQCDNTIYMKNSCQIIYQSCDFFCFFQFTSSR